MADVHKRRAKTEKATFVFITITFTLYTMQLAALRSGKIIKVRLRLAFNYPSGEIHISVLKDAVSITNLDERRNKKNREGKGLSRA